MGLPPAMVLTLASALAALPAGAPDSLADVLGMLDQGAVSFRAMSANVKWVAHTAVIDDDAVDTGTMLLKRSARDMRMRVEFMEPDRKSVALHERKLEIYYPKMQQVQEYDIGAHRDQVDQFFLIGFGTSGKDLAAAYSVKVLGGEEIAGQKATRLELIPKSADILRHMKKLEIWLADTGMYPVQQKFYLAAGDYKLATYTDVKMNPAVTDADLKLKLPKNVQRVFPLK